MNRLPITRDFVMGRMLQTKLFIGKVVHYAPDFYQEVVLDAQSVHEPEIRPAIIRLG